MHVPWATLRVACQNACVVSLRRFEFAQARTSRLHAKRRAKTFVILSATGNPQGSMGSLENEASPHSLRRYGRLEECERLLLLPDSGPLVWTFTTLRGFTVR